MAFRFFVFLSICLLSPFSARAERQGSPQEPSEQQPSPQTNVGDSSPAKSDQESADEIPAMLPHLATDRVWLSGQVNFISQWHPGFHSTYSGPNSLSPQAQDATSRVLTLFTGLRFSKKSELLCDIQETGGHGIGESFGLAGYTNLDVIRNPTLGKAPYVARLMWHQIIPIGKAASDAQRTPFSLFRKLPDRRFEIRFGKFSMPDFFDSNTYGTDSNFQFMNWTVDNAGTYDYAADTRGFTYGAIVEYHDLHWAIRFGEALMPKVANGIHLDADLGRARAENAEFELHRSVIFRREGVLRLLGFVNHANMGVYRDAISKFLRGETPVPEITAHPLTTTIKYGFGLNFEQPLNDWLGLFGRWGWNEGQHESYVYSEVDQTAEVGIGASGTQWGRTFDRFGLAFVSNGISRDHQQYLALGGSGFLLGDGRLNYGRENIAETYYTFHIWRGLFSSFDFQFVANPGYNKDRGPVFVPGLRLHVEF